MKQQRDSKKYKANDVILHRSLQSDTNQLCGLPDFSVRSHSLRLTRDRRRRRRRGGGGFDNGKKRLKSQISDYQ